MHTHRTEPTALAAYVVGAANSSAVATIGQSATIRCLAGGMPRPTVTWWRGHNMLAMAGKRHQMAKDYSLTLSNVSLADLGPYTCQAYTGNGKPATLTVTLQAYGPVHSSRPSDQPYLRYVINRPTEQPPPPQPQQPQQQPQQPAERERRPQAPSRPVPDQASGNIGRVRDGSGLVVEIRFGLDTYWLSRLDWN